MMEIVGDCGGSGTNVCFSAVVMAQNARFAPVLCANFQDGKVREDMHHYIRSFACNLNAFQYKTHF